MLRDIARDVKKKSVSVQTVIVIQNEKRGGLSCRQESMLNQLLSIRRFILVSKSFQVTTLFNNI